MKVVAINGSPKKEGNTYRLLKTVLGELEKEGISTEIISLAGARLMGCQGCQACFERKDGKCVFAKDRLNEIYAQMVEADGIVLGSPTYVADVTSEMKALIDRACYVAKANGRTLTRKVGAAVSAVRRGGAIHTVDTMNHFFQISGMIVIGSTYWNMVYGRMPGEVENDAEGMANMTDLGRNMAWVLKKLNA